MPLAGVPMRYHPALTLTNRTTPWYSDGSGFWGGIYVYNNGSMDVTDSLSEFNPVSEPVSSADSTSVASSFFDEHEIRCTIISGTRDAVHSTIANNTWVKAPGGFYLGIAGGSFTLAVRTYGGATAASCTITVA